MPGRKQVVTAKKLAILEVILSERDTLFAPISPVITQESKVQAWTKVLNHAKKVGLASEHRDWTFMRDKLYSVWKSRTMKKWDDSFAITNKKIKKLNEIDLKILAIIGEKPPPTLPPTPPETHQPELVYLESGDESNPSSSRDSDTREQKRKYPSRAKKPRQVDTDDSDTDNVQDLTLELLKTEIYLRKLQARKLEIEMGLPCSSVTKNFSIKMECHRRKSSDDEDSDYTDHKLKQDGHRRHRDNHDKTIKFEEHEKL